MTRVAVLDDYGSVARGLGPWERLDGRAEVDFIAEHLDDPAARLAPYDVVVAMRERTAFPRAVLDRLPSLRLLVTTGMMNASIDFDAARDRGVVVCGTGSRGGPTAELTWALVLGLVKHLREEDAAVRAGGWQQSPGGDLDGKRLGLLGLGRLGRRVAAVGLAFGMDVVAWSANLQASDAAEIGVHAGRARRPPAHVGRRLDPPEALRPHARAARRARAGAHAPGRAPHQHVARPDRRRARAPRRPDDRVHRRRGAGRLRRRAAAVRPPAADRAADAADAAPGLRDRGDLPRACSPRRSRTSRRGSTARPFACWADSPPPPRGTVQDNVLSTARHGRLEGRQVLRQPQVRRQAPAARARRHRRAARPRRRRPAVLRPSRRLGSA